MAPVGRSSRLPITTPTIGARASSPSRVSARERALPYSDVIVNVLKPSAKSCAITATATASPTCEPGLEAERDPDAVEGAVHDQPAAGQQPDRLHPVVMPGELLLVTAVDGQRAFEDVDGEEPADRGEHCHRHPVQPVRLLLERLGQQVEGRDAEQDAGGQAEDQMQPVARPHRHHPADQGRAERHQGQDERHAGTIPETGTIPIPGPPELSALPAAARRLAGGQLGGRSRDTDRVDTMTEVRSAAELREMLGEVGAAALAKERTRLHELDRLWLAASPFCLVATSDADGNCDVSPKGDPAGFTLVLDDATIALPERPGNRRPTGCTTS